MTSEGHAGDQEQDGDFHADITGLMERAAVGGGPQSMPDIVETARRLAERVDTDPAVQGWLHDNAMALIGQQLLVASVHSVGRPVEAFEDALGRCLDEHGHQHDPDAVLGCLLENAPGATRAWLVRDQLPALVAAQVAARTPGTADGADDPALR
jgi:hypothetical protein